MRSATKKRTGKDPEYLDFVHEQPCAVFAVDRLFTKCGGRIHAHHSGDHGFSQRAPDSTAIPLCEAHHQAGPHAVHRLGKRFYQFHGIDRDELIAGLNRKFEEEHGNRTAI
jgi:hypothetical protein